MYSSSNPDFSTATQNPDYVNNTIESNSQYGIYISSDSYPALGDNYVDWKGYTHGGFNSFSRGSGSYDIYSLNSSTIDARMNWWASNANRYGSFLISPTADEGGMQKIVYNDSDQGDAELTEFDLQMQQARIFIADSLYDEAIKVYKAVLAEMPEDTRAAFALKGIIACLYDWGKPEHIEPQLQRLLSENQKTFLGIAVRDFLSMEYIRRSDYQNALNILKDVIALYQELQMDNRTAFALLRKAELLEYLMEMRILDKTFNGIFAKPQEKPFLKEDRFS